MRVNEYIYRNYPSWNFAILKQLCEDEGIEWSEELVGYLKNSPGNMNWNLLVDFGIEPYGEDGEEESGPIINFVFYDYDHPIITTVIYQDSDQDYEYPNPYNGTIGDTFYIPNKVMFSDEITELGAGGSWISPETGTEYTYGDTYEIQGSDILTYGEPQE